MKRKKITIKSTSFSDVKNCVFCLQIDLELFVLVIFSSRSDDMLPMQETGPRFKKNHTSQPIIYPQTILPLIFWRNPHTWFLQVLEIPVLESNGTWQSSLLFQGLEIFEKKSTGEDAWKSLNFLCFWKPYNLLQSSIRISGEQFNCVCKYPIYTCTLAMAEPWPSKVLFTLGELYHRQTDQHRRDCLGEDLGEGQV